MKGVKGTLKEKIALLRLKQGDTEAFGYLYDVYVDRIHRYVMFRVSDKSMAYDITQEVFLTTWEYIVDSRPIKNLKSFIYKVAYNKVVNHYRTRGRQALLIDDIGETREPSTDHPTVDVEMQLLQKQIDKLKPEYQDVIILRHVEGLSMQEVADIVSKDVNAVRVTLHRAMTSLKKIHNPNNNKEKES